MEVVGTYQMLLGDFFLKRDRRKASVTNVWLEGEARMRQGHTHVTPGLTPSVGDPWPPGLVLQGPCYQGEV